MQDDKVDYSRYYMKNRHTYNDDTSKHTVEYIGKKKDKVEDKKDAVATSKKTRKGIKGTIITIAIILVVFSLVIFVADSLKGGYIVTLLTGKGKVESCYYAVEIGCYEDMESARVSANDVRRKRGAGYLINDGGYRVLVEVYNREEDAIEVSKRLKLDGNNARVYKLEIKKIDYLRFKEKYRNTVKTTIAFNDRMYSDLFRVGLDLESGAIDENTARMRIDGLNEEMHNVVNEFRANVEDSSDIDIVKVKAELMSIEGMLENLSKDTVKRPSLMSDIRYTSCLIVNAYRELSLELSS